MNICFFGSYDPMYARNKILIDGLQKNRARIFHCNSDSGFFIKRYLYLAGQFWRVRNKIDVIYVAFVGHLNVPLAWILGRLAGKKVVFDMFYSMYDTYVFDRRSTSPKSLKAFSFWLIDKIAVTFADLVIIDTNTHADYIAKLLRHNRSKFVRLFVGGDETIFKSINKIQLKKLIIEFQGMFTRLHGAEYFVEAAKKLENDKRLEFHLIGSTKNYFLPLEKLKELKPATLKYFPQIPVKKLALTLANSDIVVGHIGTTIKARSVITNKTFQALACGVATISGDCQANRELLKDKETTLFVKMGDANNLVEKIIWLVEHSRVRERIAINGYQLFQEKLTNRMLGKDLLKILKLT